MASSLRSAAASRIFASSSSSAARLSLRATPAPTPLSFSSSLKSLAFSSHFSRRQRGSAVRRCEVLYLEITVLQRSSLKFLDPECTRHHWKDGPGAPGGQSWTMQWLKFDNSYFKIQDIKAKRDEDLLVLPTDAVLFEDPSLKVYAEKYAEDQETFFKDYAEAHAKLSNLGAKFDPAEGIVLP